RPQHDPPPPKTAPARPREPQGASSAERAQNDEPHEPPRAVASVLPAPRVEPPPAPLRAEPSKPAPSAASAAPPAPVDALETWRKLVDHVGIDRPDLAAFLARAAPLEVAPGALTLAFREDDVSAIETERNLELVARAASQILDTPTKVRVIKDDAQMKTRRTLAELSTEEGERQRRAAIAKAKSHPRVVEAVEVLGARIKDLKLGER
ncbi:MAG TPA: hypothetical protein VFZ53_20590, partial [Polyangiaceae bacterium]